MTANELINYFSSTYGLNKEWPDTCEVDAITYANCCQAVFEAAVFNNINCSWGGFYIISLGHNRGLMFKGVELILKIS